jgi:hypothetical protein
LDLTKTSDVSGSQSGTGTGGAAFASGMVARPLPISVVLVSMEPRSAPYGTQVVYEVALKNIGGVDVTIPWSGNRIDDSTSPEMVIGADLALVAIDAGAEDTLAVRSMEGIPALPETLKTLRPGQEVIIRVSGPLRITDATTLGRFLNSLPKRITLKARLRFRRGVPHENRLIPIESVTSVAIELQRPN